MTKGKELPVHSLEADSKHLNILPLEHNNPYDFKREHRHTYFELMFIERGGGTQLIDFNKYDLKNYSCYLVLPQQVHLMNRNESTGTIIQFTGEIINSPDLFTLLKRTSFSENAAIIFEDQKKSITKLNALVDLLQEAVRRKNPESKQTATYLLHALVSLALENWNQNDTPTIAEDKNLWLRFVQMVEESYGENIGVQNYIRKLHTNERKLAAATRKYAGLSPLQVVHNRILLEAKRNLLFEEISHKEISFKLGFDSPSSFSAFIKAKTGYTPSELSAHLEEIHK